MYNNRMNNYKAFQSRTKLFEMTIDHENSENFPYTEDDLARYMLNYILSQKHDDVASTKSDDEDMEENYDKQSELAHVN